MFKKLFAILIVFSSYGIYCWRMQKTVIPGVYIYIVDKSMKGHGYSWVCVYNPVTICPFV